MKFSVIVFPGSNCDADAYYAAHDVLGEHAEYIWHKDTDLKDADVVILPGGFAHGDYLRPGAIARFSPVMQAVTRFAALFEGIYLKRSLTVWAIWFCAAMVGYGLLVWLPTIFRTVYKMPVSEALLYSSVGNIAVLFTGLAGALLIDRLGRKPIFIAGFLLGGLPLLVVWLIGKDVSAMTLMVMAAISAASMSMVQLGVWTYTPEIYPTRIRSFGAGTASAWARFASIIAPNLVAFLLVRADISGIFLALAVFAFIGALVVFLFAVETRKRLLEEISP